MHGWLYPSYTKLILAQDPPITSSKTLWHAPKKFCGISSRGSRFIMFVHPEERILTSYDDVNHWMWVLQKNGPKRLQLNKPSPSMLEVPKLKSGSRVIHFLSFGGIAYRILSAHVPMAWNGEVVVDTLLLPRFGFSQHPPRFIATSGERFLWAPGCVSGGATSCSMSRVPSPWSKTAGWLREATISAAIDMANINELSIHY